MAGLAETLSQIDDWLAVHRPGYHSVLRSPAARETLEAAQAQAGVILPDDWFILYQWHDGQDPNASASLVENRMFLCLDEVLDIKLMLDDMIGFDFEDPEHWRRGWMPLLSNGGGDYLCVDTEARTGQAGQLLQFWHDDTGRSIRFASISAWAAAMLASMKDGSYEVN